MNAAIYGAAGPDLDIATKERAGSLTPGKAVVVPLPSTSPLFSREGVTHVIHVLGPNMNPQRPNCLNNNYSKGCKVLREAYASLFESFASIVRNQDKVFNASNENSKLGESESHDHPKQQYMNQLLNYDQKGKREGAYESEGVKKSRGSINELGCDSTNSMSGKDNTRSGKTSQNMSKGWGSWAQALYNIAMHPEKHENDILEVSDDVVVVNDVYPKVLSPSLLPSLFGI